MRGGLPRIFIQELFFISMLRQFTKENDLIRLAIT
jgi:hypothetical protein